MQRQEYMNVTLAEQPAAHRAYYSQFVDDNVKKLVIQHFSTEIYTGTDMLRRSYGMDRHFNTDLTPLRQWDICGFYIKTYRKDIVQHLKECDDFITDANAVCILKEAATQIVEENQ